jgi:predicted protein tyrosine phosphatase
MSRHPTKVLFVCSQNRIRSLTAERIFAGVDGFQARSAGTQPNARIVVTEGHIGWADIIFTMEKSHWNLLRQKFGAALDGKRVIALHIPDEYQFMQPELIDELKIKVVQHIEIHGGNAGA